MNKYLLFFIASIAISCADRSTPKQTVEQKESSGVENTSIVILGNVQDAGSPQIGCKKECCAALFENLDTERRVVSLGVIDTDNQKTYLFDATPDIAQQMKMLTQYEPKSDKEVVDGIFLTHAHIGHYTGLMYLGKEAMDANATPIYVMPKMEGFLLNNGPWDQLIQRENAVLNAMVDQNAIELSQEIIVTPFLVPHRDEYSETVGYRIQGPNKSALFIPDIDKWEKWEKNIVEEIQKVDYAFLDATFYSGKEINNRDISEIPHPFVIESLEKFKDLNAKEKAKIIFIHFNHTNPLLDPNSEESQIVLDKGFKIGRINDVFAL
ncbi:pyrroloquinoline quinone biosynthesis protein B [Maribacter dokdonensis]|uniref:Pyrroloquinoline quinone biosynthesis protein B n=1 Tax=Maribacter dokdonensis TaxID=320912 RepID=A0A1H4TVM6_9FLAO|nr:MBL fold metallo-hydrolase [Maribacter dokdonensis]SEC60556.1 pyrroloquinoline quinone biosynthesis protein B [Maribacter dokdonensis]